MTRQRFLSFLTIAAQLATYTANARKLSAEERTVIDYVDKHKVDASALLERVVNIESPTEDLAGVRAVGEVFRKELETLGLTTRWIEMPAEARRAGHLQAETHGHQGKRLLLLGHLDTVLRGEKFRREGDRGFGTGIADMKGGAVIALYALKALKGAGQLNNTRITLFFAGDEEDTCEPVEVCRGDMISAAKQSDAALSFEATVRNTATVGRRGSSEWRLEIEAKTGHSSQIFRDSMGFGAIYEAARILDGFRQALSGERYLTINPGMIVGGTTARATNAAGLATGKSNVVAPVTAVTGDLRFISEEQKEWARAKMREIVAMNLPGTKATLTFANETPAMTPVEGNYALLKLLDQVSHDLGFGTVEALDPGERGAGDIAFVSNIIPSLDGIGIGGSGKWHAQGEFADLESMTMLIKRSAILMFRLTR